MHPDIHCCANNPSLFCLLLVWGSGAQVVLWTDPDVRAETLGNLCATMAASCGWPPLPLQPGRLHARGKGRRLNLASATIKGRGGRAFHLCLSLASQLRVPCGPSAPCNIKSLPYWSPPPPPFPSIHFSPPPPPSPTAIEQFQFFHATFLGEQDFQLLLFSRLCVICLSFLLEISEII